MTEASLYQRLQLHPNASQYEIESAYQRLQATYPNVPFELQQAYTVLSDPASRSAYDAMRMEPVEEPAMQPVLRFYGLFSGIAGSMRHARWKFLPVNWVAAIFLAFVGIAHLTDSLLPTLEEPIPTQTSIRQIVAGTNRARYVTVQGTVHPEPIYVEEGGDNRKFYLMGDGKALLIVADIRPDQVTETVTGQLVLMDSDLQQLVRADAAEIDIPMGQTYYLNARYRPANLVVSYLALVALFGIALLLVVPGLHGFIVFEAAEPTQAPAPLSLLPQPVWATGRYISAMGKPHFHVGANAMVIPTDDPSIPYVIHARFTSPSDPVGVPHEIHLPRGAEVEWGYDYSHGRPKPALLVRAGGRKTLLTLPDAATAAGLAALLQRSLA